MAIFYIGLAMIKLGVGLGKENMLCKPLGNYMST